MMLSKEPPGDKKVKLIDVQKTIVAGENMLIKNPPSKGCACFPYAA